MKLRIARHTNDLKPLIYFYCKLLGLQVLGEFKDHNQYDGVFLGLNNLNWQLEFTQSSEPANHHPDDDDLLVFYFENEKEFLHMKSQFEKHQIHPVKASNPYWNENGITYEDPDGFRIVITIQNPVSSF